MIDITDWFLDQNINFDSLKSFCESKITIPQGVPRTLQSDTELPSENLAIALSGLFMAHNIFDVIKNTHVQSIKEVLTSSFGTSEISGALFYPAGGFMGWHTNSNHPGTRIYISYSQQEGVNSFSYIENDEVVQSYDRAGFTVRKFEVNNSNLFWHRVDAPAKRFSLGFKTPHS